MSAVVSSPMTQLTFAWAEPDSSVAPVVAIPSKTANKSAEVVARQRVPLGVAAASTVTTDKSQVSAQPVAARIGSNFPREAPRSGKTEHISDLLLVVLDRYGISPEEFLEGLR